MKRAMMRVFKPTTLAVALTLTLAVTLVTACSNPIEQIRTGDSRPSIAFQGAPSGAEIFIDDTMVGTVGDFAGKALLVDGGTHTVKVILDGQTLVSEKVYVSGSGTKTVSVPGAKK